MPQPETKSELTTLFADVLLPLALQGSFTYRIPWDLNEHVSPGMRVVVQFGKKKFYTGLVRKVHNKPPAVMAVKYVLSVIDELPVVNEKQFALWEWMATYYLCTVGEVMNAALPPAFKLASETKVVLDPAFAPDSMVLNDREFQIVEALQLRNILTLTEISRIIGIAKVIPIVKNMIEKGILLVDEEITERYKPRTESYLSLADEYSDEAALNHVMDKLNKRAFRQLQALMAFIGQSNSFSDNAVEISKGTLLKTKGITAAAVDALIAKGILISVQRTVSRLVHDDASSQVSSIELTSAQKDAFDTLSAHLHEKQVVLFKGVTSSGKTEIYIRLMSEIIASGRQVLYLLPEIALTTQIIQRLQRYFGDSVGVYHSRYKESERVEIWNKANLPLAGFSDQKPYSIVLGARSALFLPFSDLGLIIVDEEHDTSYKQNDPAPRYNARDTAVMMGRLHNVPVLLGSATPSVESMFNVQQGKYKFAALNERFGGLSMPRVEIVDIREETRFKRMKSHFSPQLVQAISRALSERQQVILFQNRRGFSLRLECDTCHYIPECIQCDVTLIYHKQINLLKCHYCGYAVQVPVKCPECSGQAMKMKGFGTEKVEEELSAIFPDAAIARMDMDTTRTKYAYQKIIADFETQKTDILVGTQMVTKGLDFDNVGLVGVLNADGMMSYPDFRALERSYQLLAQVSGRAGRKHRQGTVLIQTYNPAHPLLQWVVDDNYDAMYNNQIGDRYKFRYPPYYRLIELSMRHKDYNVLNQAASAFASMLKPVFGQWMLGPEYPMVSRIRGQFIKNILLKTGKGNESAQQKFEIKRLIGRFMEIPDYRGVRIQIDVDPL